MSQSITHEELNVLRAHHLSQAAYWGRCEYTNRKLARKADPKTTETFGGDNPEWADKPRTPENWLARAEQFRAWKEYRQTLAKRFNPNAIWKRHEK